MTRDTWGPPDDGWPSFDAEGKRVTVDYERVTMPDGDTTGFVTFAEPGDWEITHAVIDGELRPIDECSDGDGGPCGWCVDCLD